MRVIYEGLEYRVRSDGKVDAFYARDGYTECVRVSETPENTELIKTVRALAAEAEKTEQK